MQHKESAEKQNVWSLLLERKSVLNFKKSWATENTQSKDHYIL